MSLKSNGAIASAAALFALSAVASTAVVTPASAAAAKVHCFGVNTCKGTSDCKSGAHDCKGMNDCKGQGFKELSAKACAAQHGSTTEPAAGK